MYLSYLEKYNISKIDWVVIRVTWKMDQTEGDVRRSAYIFER